VVIPDYHVVMKTVRIAELKSRLSEYLRIVRSGTSVLVLDRNEPIARIVPTSSKPEMLTVRRAAPAHKLREVIVPPPLKVRTDIVKVLLTERQGDR
jgi:prevent-host-death family protein